MLVKELSKLCAGDQKLVSFQDSSETSSGLSRQVWFETFTAVFSKGDYSELNHCLVVLPGTLVFWKNCSLNCCLLLLNETRTLSVDGTVENNEFPEEPPTQNLQLASRIRLSDSTWKCHKNWEVCCKCCQLKYSVWVNVKKFGYSSVI
jgi:hypothetical protein